MKFAINEIRAVYTVKVTCSLQSVTKHSGQNIKTNYKSNVFAPRTPFQC